MYRSKLPLEGCWCTSVFTCCAQELALSTQGAACAAAPAPCAPVQGWAIKKVNVTLLFALVTSSSIVTSVGNLTLSESGLDSTHTSLNLTGLALIVSPIPCILHGRTNCSHSRVHIQILEYVHIMYLSTPRRCYFLNTKGTETTLKSNIMDCDVICASCNWQRHASFNSHTPMPYSAGITCLRRREAACLAARSCFSELLRWRLWILLDFSLMSAGDIVVESASRLWCRAMTPAGFKV